MLNMSLTQAAVPTCFKTTYITPVPKRSNPTCLNDYSPVAVTHIIMKCFERLVLAHLKDSLPSTLDPHRFAYRCNRSTENAVSIVLHSVLTHLDNRKTYARMLYVDFSSAFNTVISSKLITKLGDLGINTSLCRWIMDFLTNRVRVSGDPHLRGPVLDHKHLQLGQESSPTTLLLEDIKEEPAVLSYPGELYHCTIKSILTNYHSLVWKLLCCGAQGTAACGENCPAHHRDFTASH